MKEIYSRMDIKQIRSFLLNGGETYEAQQETCEERIKNGERAIYARLKEIYKDGDEYETAAGEVYEALEIYKEVYTEIGMKFAAILIFQLLQ